jgi:DNA-binding MarR family transcriptional regulator
MRIMIDTWSETKKRRLLTYYNNGVSVKDITDMFACSPSSMHRVLDELHAQGHIVKWKRNDPRGTRKERNSSGAEEA